MSAPPLDARRKTARVLRLLADMVESGTVRFVSSKLRHHERMTIELEGKFDATVGATTDEALATYKELSRSDEDETTGEG